jgi:hypothetical protein
MVPQMFYSFHLIENSKNAIELISSDLESFELKKIDVYWKICKKNQILLDEISHRCKSI